MLHPPVFKLHSVEGNSAAPAHSSTFYV